MNRPIIAVNAAVPAANEAQPTTIHETKTAADHEAAAIGLGVGRGGRPSSRAWAGRSAAWRLRPSARGLGRRRPPSPARPWRRSPWPSWRPVWRRASARSRGSVILSSGGSVRAAPAALARPAAAFAAGLGGGGLARRRGPRPRRPGRRPASPRASAAGPAAGPAAGTALAAGGGLGRASAAAAGGRGRGAAARRPGPATAAPPARAAASFSLSVSGRPRLAGVGTSAATGGGRPPARWPRLSRRLLDRGGRFGHLGLRGSRRSSAFGFAAPPCRAAARISCTLGRFAIAQSQPPIARRSVTRQGLGEVNSRINDSAVRANQVPPLRLPDRMMLMRSHHRIYGNRPGLIAGPVSQS